MERLLEWLPAAIALITTGIAWGRLSAKDEAQEKALEKLDKRIADLEDRIDRMDERHEVRIQALSRHVGEANQKVAVLTERLQRRDP